MGLFDDLIPSGGGDAPPGVPRITVRPKIDIPASGRALLDTIAGSESPGYDTMYGGGKFQDFADHPRQAVPITSGPNAGRTSSAAGRYQFLGPTWDQVKQEAGLPDFSPDSQDQGAWYLAQKTYQQKTGRELARDLESAKGNPNAVAGIGKMLSGVWTSLPGGIEPNRATGSFASRYAGAEAPTDMSSQARRPAGGLFDDLIPQAAQSQQAAPEPMADNGGQFAAPLPSGENIRTAREGPSPTVATPGEALGKGALRGATFNWMDELNALARAGGLTPEELDINKANPDPAKAVAALVKGAYRLASGDPEARAAFHAEASAQRAEADRMKEQQPGTSLTGELGGALATAPFAVGAAGAGMGARILQGAKAGAAYGAISGAGEGTDLTSRVTGAGQGGLTGGLLGGAVPVGVEGLVKTGQGISKLASPIVQAVRGVRDPEAEAARRVTGALQRDMSSGSSGMTPAQFATERAAGTPVVVGDMGGTATRSLARSAADTSAEGRAALEAVTSERYITQNPRISQFIKETFDFPDVGAKLDQLQEAARRANAPAYMKAYKEGAGGIWDSGLEQFSQAPVMQNAIRSAFLTARNRAALDGFPPIKNPFTLDKATGIYELKTAEDGSRALPNLQFWDHVKRNLDKVNSPESRAAAQALRDHLDEVVPSYKTARAGAAGWFGAEDALDAGAKFATMGGLDAMKIAQARGQVAKMSAPDRKLFETGFVSNLLAKIESRKDGQDVVKAVFDSPFARKQAEIALGPEKAALLEARLQTERVMNALKNEVGGGSPTARRLYELGMAGATNPYTLAGAAAGVSSYSTGSVGPGDAFAAGLVFAARKGQIKIDGRVAQKVGEMLASDQPNVVQKGLSIIARNDTMKRALRAFDVPAIGASAQQGRGLVPIQAGAIGRADDNQNDVPRPPGQ